MHNIHNAVTVLKKYQPLTCALKNKTIFGANMWKQTAVIYIKIFTIHKKLAKYPNILPHLCKNSHFPENSQTNSLIHCYIHNNIEYIPLFSMDRGCVELLLVFVINITISWCIIGKADVLSCQIHCYIHNKVMDLPSFII